MSIFLPFNHRPSSTTVRTGSYTVPSGKYARVTILEADSGFTLNGTTIISQLKYEGLTIADGAGYFQNNTNYNLIGVVGMYVTSGSPTASVRIGRDTGIVPSSLTLSDGSSTIDQNQAYTVNISPGEKIMPVFNDNRVTLYWSLTAHESVGNLSSPLWVNTGGTISGTKYIVEEYNIA